MNKVIENCVTTTITIIIIIIIIILNIQQSLAFGLFRKSVNFIKKNCIQSMWEGGCESGGRRETRQGFVFHLTDECIQQMCIILIYIGI